MNNQKSLKVTTGVFLFFLAATAIDNIDHIYIPLKQSIAADNIPAITIYATELIVFFTMGFSMNRLTKNIYKQKFFIKQNYLLFFAMGLALFLPPAVHVVGDIFDKVHDWQAIKVNDALWFAGSLFLIILAEIFRYGHKLKEEQDLTI